MKPKRGSTASAMRSRRSIIMSLIYCCASFLAVSRRFVGVSGFLNTLFLTTTRNQHHRRAAVSASSSSSLVRLFSSSSKDDISSRSSGTSSSSGGALPLNGTEQANIHHPPEQQQQHQAREKASSFSEIANGLRGEEDENNDEIDEDDDNNDNTNSTMNTTNGVGAAGGSVLAIDPSDIRIYEEPTAITTAEGAIQDSSQQQQQDQLLLRQLPFVSMFRGSANYIANHRNTAAVYHIPGGLLSSSDSSSSNNTVFRDLMNDVSLTWLLGMKIVLVIGCRHQIEQRIGHEQTDFQHGLRVTDADTLRVVKEEAGYVRFEVERQLARALRMQGGGTSASSGSGRSSSSSGSSSMTKTTHSSTKHGKSTRAASQAAAASDTQSHGYYDGNVVSGNFYSAQPFGILDGVDYKYTGFVRRVETEKIRQLHDNRDICLLTTLGVSPSGEVFNVNSESLAAIVAGALGASKVVYFTERELDLRHRTHGNKIQCLRFSDAKHLLKYYGVQMHRRGYVSLSSSDHGSSDENNEDEGAAASEHRRAELTSSHMDMLLKIGWCTAAVAQGVKRAHIISPKHGALLQELYTRDGSGTLISADLYEGIRRATVLDVSAIHTIITPLIQAGTLIDRPKAVLEKDIETYYVYTRDNHIVACGQLKKFEDGFAEIGCLVVNKDFQGRGRGDAMLGYLERLCLLNGCNKIFVLSTQTMEWFVERGFDKAVVEQLPPSRQATYNHKRASQIYMKTIESNRDLDASELWWNR